MNGVATALAALALAGCPRPNEPVAAPAPGTTESTTEVEGGAVPAPRGTSDVDLGEPPPPDPNTFGLAYLELVHERIRGPWRAFLIDCQVRLPATHELNDAALGAEVEILLGTGGQLAAVTFTSKSRSVDFDAAITEIVGDAGPFPPPPPELVSDDDRVHLHWLFARDRRQAGLATARVEVVHLEPEKAVPKFLAAGDVTTAAERLADAVSTNRDPATGERYLALAGRVFGAAIRAALRSEDLEVQRVAVAAAGAAKLAPAARELRSIADGSADLPLRREALTALGAIGDRDAVAFLREILARDHGQNADISGAAAQALGALGAGDAVAKLVDAWLSSDDDESRWAAMVVLTHYGVPSAGDTLRSMIVDDGAERPRRLAACIALGRSADGARDLAGLRAGIEAGDPALRAACASGIALAAERGVKNRATYWKVVELLEDRDERVRAAAVLAAARLEPVRFAREMYLLARERSATVLAAYAEALASVRGKPAFQRLAALAGHEEAAVRRAAARALLARRENAARRIVSGLLDDGDAEVRALATGAVTDVEKLAPLLEDEAPQVRGAALEAIIALRGKPSMLGETVTALAEAPAAGADRARIARAWLVQ